MSEVTDPSSTPIPLLPTGTIDFGYLRNRTGSDEGGRAMFEEMVIQLVGVDLPQIQNVRPLPGDWGIDGFVGDLDDVVAVWQSKYFFEKFDTSQKQQVTRSLKKLLTKAAEEGFKVSAWTLCLPIDLEADAMRWWSRLARKAEREHGLACDVWSATQLRRRLLRPSSEGVRPLLLSHSVGRSVPSSP